jgi:proteasome lid subunit RPN8/RPN11
MIRLSDEQAAAIKAHGEETYPHECCGVLLGGEQEGVKVVGEVWRAANARDDSPQNRYLIPPQELLRAEKEARARGLQIIGYYHSHPDVAARPSQYDRQHAWPWYSYLIVSVRAGQAAELLAWVVEDEQGPFVAEEIDRRSPIADRQQEL